MIEPEIPYEKIAAYLTSKLSTSEKLWMECWIQESPENKEVFNSLKEEWKYVGLDNSVEIDKVKVWDTIKKHIKVHSADEGRALVKRSLIVKIASIAASIALLAGAAASLLIKNSIDNVHREQAITKIETPIGQKMQMTLPDKTQVWLNSGSVLTYSENFNKDNREISLIGEAYFDVQHNAQKEFIVKTSVVDVIVKGTSFDVSAYQEDPYISVSLVEGSVNVMDGDNNLLTALAPNENVKVNKSSLRFVHTKNIKDAFPLWTKEELVFYNVDLFELTRRIERWYGVEIKLINPVVDQKYTFSMKTESIRELLDLFDKITPIEYTVNGKEVTIRCK